MSFVATAIVASSVIGAGASLLAGDKQSSATNRAADISNAQYQQNRTDLAPWRASGVAANNRLMELLGLTGSRTAPTRAQFTTPAVPGRPGTPWMWNPQGGGMLQGTPGAAGTPERFDQAGFDAATAAYNAPPEGFGSLLKTFSPGDLMKDPGYQFGLTEGEKALNRSAASRGMYFAPATSKELSQFNTDYAGTKYNEAFNRDQASKGQIYSFLSGASGAGENAAGQTANLGAQNASNVGNLVTSGGAAQAAGLVGAANAATGAAGQYLNYTNQSRLLDLLNSNRASTQNYVPPSGYTQSIAPTY